MHLLHTVSEIAYTEVYIPACAVLPRSVSGVRGCFIWVAFVQFSLFLGWFAHTTGQRPATEQSDSDQDVIRDESATRSTPSVSPQAVQKKAHKKHKGATGNAVTSGVLCTVVHWSVDKGVLLMFS